MSVDQLIRPMPRKPIIRSQEHFYHIVARCNNKEEFYIPLDQVWKFSCQLLVKLQREDEIVIGAFVLMSNHFHLLIKTPKEDIDRVMYKFMKELTFKIQKSSGRINRIFGGRYKGSIIEYHRYLMNVYKYIYRNPVAAGITDRAEDWDYSTFNSETRKSIPFKLHRLFEFTPEHEKRWINIEYKIEEADSIRFGLSRTVFEYKKEKSTNRSIEPSDVLLTE